MFRIKICGITNLNDALAAVDAGADAVGLNFFNKSRRFVDPEIAREIAASLPAGSVKVGVFVDHEASEIVEMLQHVALDCVQLHGDEPPTLLGQLPKSVGIVRAFRGGKEGLVKVPRYLEECRFLGRLPDAVLIDADAGTQFGGTGQLADWTLIVEQRGALAGLPLLLAGGLTPDNVRAAIAAVRPDGVDVASGVERQPGLKDTELVTSFVAAAQNAFNGV